MIIALSPLVPMIPVIAIQVPLKDVLMKILKALL
jgi:hypothetical protein